MSDNWVCDLENKSTSIRGEFQNLVARSAMRQERVVFVRIATHTGEQSSQNKYDLFFSQLTAAAA